MFNQNPALNNVFLQAKIETIYSCYFKLPLDF